MIPCKLTDWIELKESHGRHNDTRKELLVKIYRGLHANTKEPDRPYEGDHKEY
jgi:hypothetical protein